MIFIDINNSPDIVSFHCGSLHVFAAIVFVRFCHIYKNSI